MITKLPNWIEYGAFALAGIAGWINAVGFLGLDRLALSHVTGTVTLLGVTAIGDIGPPATLLAGILIAFLAGAVISGVLVRDTALRLDRRYDSALMVEAILILAAYGLLSNGSSLGFHAAAMACGVQNALATTYSGAIVRSTHLTGVFTDLGITIGACMRGHPLEKRKGILYLLIISGFASGGIGGAWLFGLFGFGALLIPAGLCLLLSFGFRFYRRTPSAFD